MIQWRVSSRAATGPSLRIVMVGKDEAPVVLRRGLLRRKAGLDLDRMRPSGLSIGLSAAPPARPVPPVRRRARRAAPRPRSGSRGSTGRGARGCRSRSGRCRARAMRRISDLTLPASTKAVRVVEPSAGEVAGGAGGALEQLFLDLDRASASRPSAPPARTRTRAARSTGARSRASGESCWGDGHRQAVGPEGRPRQRALGCSIAPGATGCAGGRPRKARELERRRQGSGRAPGRCRQRSIAAVEPNASELRSVCAAARTPPPPAGRSARRPERRLARTTQPRHRRPDPGRRGRKAPGPTSNSGSRLDPVAPASRSGGRTRRCRLGADPVDFLCNMTVRVAQRRRAQNWKQQRRRDVVGQVADHPRLVAALRGSAREVELSASASCSTKPGRAASEGSGCEVAVDLDRIQRAGGLEQRRGQAPRPVRSPYGASPGWASMASRIRRSSPDRAGSAGRSACGRPWPARARGWPHQLERGVSATQAARIGATAAGEAERRAVVHRGAHDRAGRGHVDRMAEAGVLQHRQAWSWNIASTTS